MLRSIVLGVGAYLPEKIMTNKAFEATLDTTDAWISERTGISERHIVGEGEFTSDLGTKAALDALKNADLTTADIDLIVVATTTPDDTMPSTATRIQQKLGIKHGAAFDVNAACSGFVYALTVADSLLRTGQAKRALVIGAETFSRILDWTDRSTCILFGDGAGAMILEASENAGDRGVLSTKIHADGEFGKILATNGGVSSTQTTGTVYMLGKEVFRHAVAKMSSSVQDEVRALGMQIADIDLLVPHQANSRIMESIADKLALPADKIVSTVKNHANTSAASIPLALSVAYKDGRLQKNKLVVLTALGAGLTWGSCIIKW